MPTAPSKRPLLAQRDFSALWWGQFISIFGDRLNYLALGGMLLHHTGNFQNAKQSSLLLGVLGNVMLAPVLLFAPFAGPWLDRWNLKRTLVISDSVRALLVLFIPLAYSLTNSVVPVFAIVFLLFTCNVFFLPAKSALTPTLVSAPQLLAANTLLSMAGIAATALGALSGGWVVDHWGWGTALYIDSATYLVSVATLSMLRDHSESHSSAPPVTLRGYFREIGEGLMVVRRSPAVGLALTALGAVWVGGGFLQVAGNQHIQRAARDLAGMERVGILMAVLGVGSGLGTWWVNGPGRRVPQPLLLGLGLLLAGGWMVGFAVSSRFAVFAIAGFLIGLCIAPCFVITETLLQQGADPNQRGRVFSLRDFAMRVGFQLAILVAGFMTPLLGTTPTLLVAAGVIATAGGLSILWGRRSPGLNRFGATHS
ncbi:MAG: MFS transporter [Candidatus Eisenbacteria bacterium]